MAAIDGGSNDGNRAQAPFGELAVQNVHATGTLGILGVCIRLDRGDHMEWSEWRLGPIAIHSRKNPAGLEMHCSSPVKTPRLLRAGAASQIRGRCPLEVVVFLRRRVQFVSFSAWRA